MSRPRFESAKALGAVVLALGALACRSHADGSPPLANDAGTAASAAKPPGSARDPDPAASNVTATQTEPLGAGDVQPPLGRDWTGAYQYEECGGPSALTPGGPAACWQYIIEIARQRGDDTWRAYIAMDGYMTMERDSARGEESGAELRLRFEPKPAAADEAPSTHEAGELLLTLFSRGGETWIRFEAMRPDSGRREAKLERLRPPAPGAAGAKTMNPDPEGFLCKTDVDCVLHRCNVKRGRCAYPCESDTDCGAGTRCGPPACIPVGAVGAKRTKKK